MGKQHAQSIVPECENIASNQRNDPQYDGMSLLGIENQYNADGRLFTNEDDAGLTEEYHQQQHIAEQHRRDGVMKQPYASRKYAT